MEKNLKNTYISLTELLSCILKTNTTLLINYKKVKEVVSQLCPTLCSPMDCSSPGSSVHGILQARILEQIVIPFSRGSSWPRDQTQASCIAGRFFTIWATRELHPCLFRGFSSIQLLSRVWLSNPMDCSRPGFLVHHQFLLTQTHDHWVSDVIQPSHPLLLPSPPAFNISQHQDLFQWVSSLHQVAQVLEFQLQHQSFQWILRTDFL